MPPRKGSPAELLLKRVHEKYLSLETYQDQGTLTTTTIYPDRKEQRTTRFKTLFGRPDFFRFEWIEDDLRSALFKYREEVILIAANGKICQRLPNLALGIAAATGISHGLAHDIPSHFFPDPGGFILAKDIKRPAITADEKVNSWDCRVISGGHPQGGDYKVFVEHDSSLIRGIKYIRKNTPEASKSTWNFAKRMMKILRILPGSIRRTMPSTAIDQGIPDLTEADFERIGEYEQISNQIRSHIEVNHQIPDSDFEPILPDGCNPAGPDDFSGLIDSLKD